jgi:phage gpG-like protein
MEKCAKLVEDEAKDMIGNDKSYGYNLSPYSRWKKLAPSTIADKQERGFPTEHPLERTRRMANTIKSTWGRFWATVGTNDQVALWQEGGTAGPRPIPPRTFMGGAAVRKGKQIQKLIGIATEQVLRGKTIK